MGEILDWDSCFFGQRIARSKERRLSEGSARQLLDWCRSNSVSCLYFLADSSDAETAHWANEHRFAFVDVRLTFNAPLGRLRVASSSSVSRFEDSDLPRLREMARVSHSDSRFYFDQRFPRERCDLLFETWIERSCSGWADAVFVARDDGRVPIGYCTCNKSESGIGSIGLIAVDAAQRGRGAGQQLVSAATEYFRQQGIGEVQVVTQGRNRASQRLYQRCGFQTEQIEIWYHRWFSPDDAEMYEDAR